MRQGTRASSRGDTPYVRFRGSVVGSVPDWDCALLVAGFFAAPEGVDVVEVAHGRLHDVDDEFARVHQRPFAAVAFGAEDFKAGFFEAGGNVVGEGFDLAGAVAAGDDHAGEQ